MSTPSKRTVAGLSVGGLLLALLPYALPYAEKAFNARTRDAEERGRQEERMRQLELRVERLERRGRFFHGTETPVESRAEAAR